QEIDINDESISEWRQLYSELSIDKSYAFPQKAERSRRCKDNCRRKKNCGLTARSARVLRENPRKHHEHEIHQERDQETCSRPNACSRIDRVEVPKDEIFYRPKGQ